MEHLQSNDFGTADTFLTPVGEPVKVRLKWFNAPKGFGFVVPFDQDIDAFLHITVLQQASIHALGEGAELLCHINHGPKGSHVTHVTSLLHQGMMPETLSPQSIDRAVGYSDQELMRVNGAVKWYKPDKGFGFIVPDDGRKDVFVHKTCLDRLGLDNLLPGQRVRMSVRSVPKGREVVELEFPVE